MTTTGNRCQAKNNRGEPCQAYAGAGSKFCFWHDPKRRKARKAARSAGGRARHGRTLATGDREPVTIGNIGDVVKLVEDAINDLLTLENSISRARTVGYLAGVIVSALKDDTMEQRLAALEAILKERTP